MTESSSNIWRLDMIWLLVHVICPMWYSSSIPTIPCQGSYYSVLELILFLLYIQWISYSLSRVVTFIIMHSLMTHRAVAAVYFWSLCSSKTEWLHVRTMWNHGCVAASSNWILPRRLWLQHEILCSRLHADGNFISPFSFVSDIGTDTDSHLHQQSYL